MSALDKHVNDIIYVGFCHPGEVKTRWMESILGILGEFPCIIKGAEGGPLISRARNMILESFLQTEATHLLMTDCDVVFGPEDVQFLLKARKPVVGALYFGILGGNPNSTFPVALSRQQGVLQSLPKVPKRLSRVDAVGMGLTLIERAAIVDLDPRSATNYPFAEGYYCHIHGFEACKLPGLEFVDKDLLPECTRGRHHGEDTVFCLRAKKAGYETWLEPNARVGHIKPIIL